MITVLINGVDRTDQISQDGFMVQQVLGEQRDTAHLIYKKYGSRSYVPAVLDTVLIKDGTTKIFGGRIMTINETSITPADGLQYQLECADYSVDLDALLVSETYESMSVHDIIADIIANYAPAFTYANVSSTYVVTKIVFNQVTISNCLKRLADILKYDWYVDPDKDVHFFGKYTNSAPFNLTDTSNNYVNKSLSRKLDGTQLTNQVKFRGGIYDAPTYTDKITVKGSETKSFKLPYGFANLSIKVNGVSKTVGIDFSEDNFSTKDVLYNFNDQSFRFAAALTDGDVIEYSGNPKQRLLQIAADAGSIAIYGIREKLVEDKDIVDPAIARKRAASELEAYKTQESMATFDTYTAGLRSGMLINLTSTLRNSDTDFLIRSVTFSCFTADTYFYKVECVTVKKQTLTEILGSLLQPDAVNDDENESNEFMQTDLRTIYVAETITPVNSGTLPAGQKDIKVITATENIQKDPLGAGVEPTWVVGYYFPKDPAMVLDMPLDEAAGSAVTDNSHKGNNGTITGATWGTDSDGSGALVFGSSNTNKITISNAAGAIFNNTDFAVAMRFKRNAISLVSYLFAHPESGGTGNRIYIQFSSSNNKIALTIGSSSLETDFALTDTASFHTIAVNFDRTNQRIKVYLDGTLWKNWASTPAPGTALQPNIYIGNQSGGASQSAAATIGHIKAWKRLLSDAEMIALTSNINGYFSADLTDTKRNGLLNNSLKVY